MNRKQVILSTLWTGWGLFVLSLFVIGRTLLDPYAVYVIVTLIEHSEVEGWTLLFLALTNVCMLITAVAYYCTWIRVLRLLLYAMPIAAVGICIFGIINPYDGGSPVHYSFYMWNASFVLVSLGLFLDRKSSVHHS